MDRKHPERLVVSEVSSPSPMIYNLAKNTRNKRLSRWGVGLGACTLNGVRWHMLQGSLSWPDPLARFFVPRPIFIGGESVE